MLPTIQDNSHRFFSAYTKKDSGKVALDVDIQDQATSEQGNYKLTLITSTWPSNNTFAIIPATSSNIRSFRLRATKTAGATSGAVVKTVYDADNETLAEQMLTLVVPDPNTQAQAFDELEDGIWTEWIDYSEDESLPGLLRADFLASADTWTVKMEVR